MGWCVNGMPACTSLKIILTAYRPSPRMTVVIYFCRHLYPDKKENLAKLRQHLLESSNEMAPLKVWQVQELSLQAAERIMSSPKEEALKVLTNIAQNFPLQVSKFTGISAFWPTPNGLQSSLLGCCSFGPDHGGLPISFCANI